MIFLQFIEVLVSFKYVVYIQTRTWMFHVINQCCQIPVSKYKSELKNDVDGVERANFKYSYQLSSDRPVYVGHYCISIK